MSGPFGSSQWMYSSGGFYDFPIEQSLKFNDDDSSYLSWTPASAGNRKTWTWSGWVKRCELSDNHPLLGLYTGSQYEWFRFSSDDKFRIYLNTLGVDLQTTALYRDPSSWYHIVISFDTTQATSSDRIKLYVNGQEISVSGTYPSLNAQSQINNNSYVHYIGSNTASGQLFDGYLAEVNFIDGQALDPTSFGEFKSGVWIPKDPSGLTYGTNGFRLSFQNDTVSEGMNVVTYRGTGSTGHSVNGIGFTPDFVWGKRRDGANSHWLMDSVRGAGERLISNSTAAEDTKTDILSSFNSDGFTLGNNTEGNASGGSYVAWCWDAGSGSPVSNTDGSITSTVKANAAYGFSIISYTGTGSAATIGHGLSSAPEAIIVKNRNDGTQGWHNYFEPLGPTKYIRFDTSAAGTATSVFNDTAPTSSVFSVGTSPTTNGSGNAMIAYAFHSVAGYSSIGSFTGNGVAGNGPTITTGFKPAFVMYKKTSGVMSWNIYDGTRNTSNPVDHYLYADTSAAETTNDQINFLSNGFQIITADTTYENENGGEYIYIAFADTRDNAFWRDQSGNGNDWQPNNLTYQDSLPDSTTNNFAVLNPLAATTTLAEGNLRSTGSGSISADANATMGSSSGKWYFETYVVDQNAVGNKIGINGENFLSQVNYRADGDKTVGGSITAYGATWTNGDIIGCAFDVDTTTIEFYKNGVSQGSFDYSGSLSSTAGYVWPYYIDGSAGNSLVVVANFGQDSSFAGNKPAQGNTDDNGYGDFYYAPPSGYLALCTANLPDPVIDPAQDDVPADYFQPLIWSGTGVTQQIPLNFTADFVWAKERTVANAHRLYDVIRGENYDLITSTTNAEAFGDYGLDFLGHDYIEVEGSKYFGLSGKSFVSWNWLAGNGTSSNTDGSITSTVSVNQKAGFSIVGYDSNPSGTVGHGLGVAPKVVIEKKRDAASDWFFNHTIVDGSYDFMRLNTTAVNSNAAVAAPTSTVFTPNSSSDSMIAYCFAEVEGYSKFGKYTGTGSTAFVYCGFRPAWVMIKKTNGTSDWRIFDNQRSPYNEINTQIEANTSGAEFTGTLTLDMLSNGFNLTSSIYNANGDSYIFMAFAENPFKYANAR